MILLSANYGGYDRPKRIPGCVVHSEETVANCHMSHRYRSKAIKCAPQLMGVDDVDIIWVDSSMNWSGRDLQELLQKVPSGGVGMWRHRWRDCIYQEADASLFHRYEGEPIMKQVDHYRKKGHPEHWGLWEAGIIVWRGAQYHIGEYWLAEQLAWTSQDQISLPYVLRDNGVEVTDLGPGTVVDNPWFSYEEHLKGATQ